MVRNGASAANSARYGPVARAARAARDPARPRRRSRSHAPTASYHQRPPTRTNDTTTSSAIPAAAPTATGNGSA